MLKYNLPSAGAASNGDMGVPTSALEVRQRIYSHDPLTRGDMDLVFAAVRQSSRSLNAEWTSLFSEAVTDYMVHQNTPADYIPDDKAAWLMAELTKGGGVSTKVEFAMLIDVMKSAMGVPPALSAFALNEIKSAILSGKRTAFTDEDHPAGRVCAADVEALRAVLYAATAGSPGHVTREEAEALFEIAHATAQGKVDPSFDDLFARAVGNYLMAICEHVPSRSEALHRDQWLDEREHMSGFFSRLFNRGGESVMDLLRTPLEAAEDDIKKLNAEDDAARAESEKVTADEAQWVMDHLTREGPLTSAERRLLQWLGNEVFALPEKLKEMVAIAEVASDPKTPFDHRHATAS
jgi:hypothetical protein